MKSEQLLAAFTDSSGEAVAETEEVLPDTEDIDEVSDADAASDVEQQKTSWRSFSRRFQEKVQILRIAKQRKIRYQSFLMERMQRRTIKKR